jgi:hypothetical protein
MIYIGLVQDDFAFAYAIGKVHGQGTFPKFGPDSTPYFENALALRLYTLHIQTSVGQV